MTPEEVAAALVNHLWQSTVFVIAVWLATLAFRRNSARVRCGMWTAASIKFLVPLSLLASLGERLQWRAAPAAVQPAVSFILDDVLAPASAVAAAPAPIAESSLPWPGLALAVWSAGAAVVLASWWRQWMPIRASLRDATPILLGAEFNAAGLAVLSSPSMPEPGVVGVRRPRLLLPAGLAERLTPAQLRALIAHERCHIRCHDNLAAAIHMLAESMFWFHPAVWWIETRLVDERERACDEAVLRAGCRPQDYAEGILEVCRQSVGGGLVCVAGVSGSRLRTRVEAIMRSEIGRPMTPLRRWALAVAAAAAVGVPIAGGALTAQSQLAAPASLAFAMASVSESTLFRGQRFQPGPRELSMETSLFKARMTDVGEGRFRTIGSSLHQLLQVAYSVSEFQVEGGPPWVRTDRYAIEAQAAGPATPDQIRGMLQSLLAERFDLALRRQTRTLPVYELVPASGGLKIAAMKEGDCIARKDIRWDLIDLEAPLFVCGGGGRIGILSQSPETRQRPRWPRVYRLELGEVSMSALVGLISFDVGRVIVDKTGFSAPFNLLLDYAPPAAVGPFTFSGPTIFEALQEQLGLGLQPSSAAVDVLVIEQVARPSPN